MSWWLILRTPDGVHCWDLGDGDSHDDEVVAAKALLGVPAGDGWTADGSPWDIQLTRGTPHPTLLARAMVHDRADLSTVDNATRAQFLAADRAAQRAQRMDAARAVLAGLDPADRAALLAELRRQ